MTHGTIRHPLMVYLLSMLTCGIYGIYWFFVFSADVNRGLGENRFNPVLDFVLIWVTCGLWGLWWSWQVCEALVEIQEKWGVKPKMDAALLWIIAFFGLGMIFKQLSLNHAFENGTPGGGYLPPPDGSVGQGVPPHNTPHHQQHQQW